MITHKEFLDQIKKVIPVKYSSVEQSRSDLSVIGTELVNKCKIAWIYDLLEKTYEFEMRTPDNKMFVGKGYTAREAFDNKKLK